ncbi:tetratricopeptide repeat protein 12 isoform X1 [Labrus mixtus]|uniref:tetratricopeptide repeat protein 12 isoform X1 n=1 Tax=Labrus mixtus TaxID=508554 RepID=UPI0029BFB979|nr:tetratricopeptide repeat protein 12 isoform X1 [Labrus mixtus]
MDKSKMEKLEDIEIFLKNVDTINELVKDLDSSDVEVQHKAMGKADSFIAALDQPGCRTKVNKTTINTNPPPQPSSSVHNESPENFMKIMEKDAEERSVRRIEREKKATALKDRGNEAFALGDYETALKYYSDGLEELRDMQPLYTNRAQTYMKLGKHEEAVSDCEWALKCNEKCIKAYLLMGKAYLALKNYNESRNCFEKIEEIEPGKDKMAKELLMQVNLVEEKESQELKAMQEFDKGEGKATTVHQLLEKLSKPGQMPFYYCGGLDILSQAVSDCTDQTLFRLNNGFSIISNDMVRSCLLQETKGPDHQELCASVLKLWRVICYGNDENQKLLMTCPVTRQSIVDLVTSEHVAVRLECLALLYMFSEKPHGRRLAIDNLNIFSLARNLMKCIAEPKRQEENTAVHILEKFAVENKFHKQLRSVLTDSVILPFTTILKNVSPSSRHVLPSLISTVDHLARDDVIHRNFALNPECWKAFLDAIKQSIVCEYKEVLYPLLGLIINLSNVTSPALQDHAVSLCDCCLGLLQDSDGGVITRAAGVLSTVLPQSSEAVLHVIEGGVVRTMRWLLKGTGQAATKYAIKTLTVCTAASQLAREELLKSDKKLSILRRVLGSSCDEMVTGNAALCLAHCLELEGIASNLLGTDIVPLLLRHAAGDAKRTAVRQNAAIALGKLCRSEPRCPLTSLYKPHAVDYIYQTSLKEN